MASLAEVAERAEARLLELQRRSPLRWGASRGELKSLLAKGEFVEAHEAARLASERYPGYDELGKLLEEAEDGAKDSRLSMELEKARELMRTGELYDAVAAARRALDDHPSAVLQPALAAFMAEGHFAAHVRRMRRLYAARQAALLAAELVLGQDDYCLNYTRAYRAGLFA